MREEVIGYMGMWVEPGLDLQSERCDSAMEECGRSLDSPVCPEGVDGLKIQRCIPESGRKRKYKLRKREID